MADPWIFYIIKNGNATYAGVSPNPTRRLRQHNQELAGGAKYTTSKSPNWHHVYLVEGFQTKQQALQFEWAVKHEAPRNKGGLAWRTKKLYGVLNKERWTRNAPLAETVPLVVTVLPATEPATEPTTQPTTQSTTQSTTEPTTQSTTEPTTQSTTLTLPDYVTITYK